MQRGEPRQKQDTVFAVLAVTSAAVIAAILIATTVAILLIHYLLSTPLGPD